MKKYKTRKARHRECLKVGTIVLIPKETRITTAMNKPDRKSKKSYVVKLTVSSLSFSRRVFWKGANGYWCSAAKEDVLVVTGLK